MNIIADTLFWQNFWPNFWANLIVGVLITSVISFIIKSSRKANAEVTATVRKNQNGQIMVQFGILNSGNISFNPHDVCYHIFVKEDRLEPVFVRKLIKERRMNIHGNIYVEFNEYVKAPIFPKKRTNAVSFPIVSFIVEPLDYLYYLSTIHGVFPRSLTIEDTGDFIDGIGTIKHIRVVQDIDSAEFKTVDPGK